MQADTREMEGESAPKGSGRVRLKTLDDLDRRTTAARVVFELRDNLAADLGGKANLSVMKLELIDNVACLGAMLKDAAASYITGQPDRHQRVHGPHKCATPSPCRSRA